MLDKFELFWTTFLVVMQIHLKGAIRFLNTLNSMWIIVQTFFLCSMEELHKKRRLFEFIKGLFPLFSPKAAF